MALFLAATILWALVWLLYRAWQVCQTPNEVLVDKLGLDIPPAPEVTLEEITAREIRIAWKQPEFQNSIHKHLIQINNAKVGETKRAETAVAIGNLLPGHIYHICIFAISAANFQTASAVLHVRTKPLPLSQIRQDEGLGGPSIQASIPRSTATLATPSAPVMSRELSGGQLQGKRLPGGRKSFPVAISADPSHVQMDDVQKCTANDDASETLEQLAERLKGLQHENENMDKQINEEEEEHNSSLKELEKQRDELKQRVKEKDEASGDLKKHVNKLESVNRTVQSERAKRERLLQQKEAERKKRQDDIVRWQEQISQMDKDITRAKEEKSRVEEEAAKQVNETRAKIANEQAEIKGIDDEIQDKGGRIKRLEEERKRLQGGDGEDGKELDYLDIERARQWEIKFNSLNVRYVTLSNLHAQAQQQYQEAQERLKWLNAQRSSGSGSFTLLPHPDLDLSQPSGLRRPRHRSSLASNVSSPISFPTIDPSLSRTVNYNPPSTSSPKFAPNPAFFNINLGMAFRGSSDQLVATPSESDISTNNQPMSPRADELLPSDLLGDEEMSIDLPPSSMNARYTVWQPSFRFEGIPHRSPSPMSSESRSTSLFASPHESQSNLRDTDCQPSEVEIPGLSHGEALNGVQSASRLLSGIFSFHRQRGKTLDDGSPVLGTLKQGQSRSFPKDLDGIDPIGSRRRRLSHAGNWANPMSLFPRSGAQNVTADSSSDRLPSRKSAFPNIFSSNRFGSGNSSELLKQTAGPTDQSGGYNQFSPRHDPIDPSSILGTVRRDSLSPRPASTFSFDNQLPYPSTDHQPFGWPSSDAAGQRGSRGFDWASSATWSQAPSRRSSAQFGSSSHLPLGLSTEHDFLQGPFEKQHRPLQAPIGTRPSSSHRPVTPKLNPTAPSFKLFSKKSEKEKDKGKDKEMNLSKLRDHDSNPGESPPSESRRSRSIATSATESHESLEFLPSGSYTDSASVKESFIQKITRKSSSSKFNLSWKDRAGLFSKKNDSSQGDADEDNSSDAQPGKNTENTIYTVSSIDKSNKTGRSFFTRKSKRMEKTASESSERASETGDEEPPEDN